MTFDRLDTIALRSRMSTIGDVAVPGSLLLFTLTGFALFLSF